MSEWMNEWINEWINEYRDVRLKELRIEWMKEGLKERTKKWKIEC